ncbi:MAG: hypothetical protein ACI4XP_03905 [Acutalibacteraceae bacterium]
MVKITLAIFSPSIASLCSAKSPLYVRAKSELPLIGVHAEPILS